LEINGNEQRREIDARKAVPPSPLRGCRKNLLEELDLVLVGDEGSLVDAVAADQQLVVQGQSKLSQTDPLLQREVQRLDGTHKQTYWTDAPAVWLLVQNEVGFGFRGPAPLELGQINRVQERCNRSGNVMIRFLKTFEFFY